MIAALDSGYLNIVKAKYSKVGTYSEGIIDGSVVIGREYIVVVDGVSEQVDSDVVLYEENNKLWAPIRFVGEALGSQVEWDSSTQQIVIMNDGHSVIAEVDSGHAVVEKGTTYIDLGYVAKEFSYDLTWDLGKKTIVFVTIES